MTYRIVLAAPALLFSMFAAAPALAEGPEAAVDPAPAPAEPAVVVSSAEIAPVVIDTPAPVVDDYAPEPYVDEPPYVEDEYPYESEPERRTTLELDSGYIGFGIAPGMTIYHKGFHPNTRLELEFGGTLEHRYRDLALSFGVVTHMTPYYERKTPSYGADVTMTAMLGPVYLRTGLGALGGLPRQHLLHQTTAGIGGVVGAGLTFGRQPMIRVGVDYDFRVNTKLEPVHTFLLAVRIACCRSD
jgi:hypothetical protein